MTELMIVQIATMGTNRLAGSALPHAPVVPARRRPRLRWARAGRASAASRAVRAVWFRSA